MAANPETELSFPDDLFESTSPFLIGVRHHSAAMSAILPTLLDDYKPDAIFLELPIEFADWIRWVQDESTEAPIALVSAKDEQFSFYPFAEFSPEWATIRWAGENKVPVIPIDILVDLPGSDGSRAFDNFDLGKFWDRAVECHAEKSTAEEIRKAALRIGWALRSTSTRSERDLARETWMRKTIKEHKCKRGVAVVGSFHAAALLSKPLFFEEVETEVPEPSTVSIVRYNHALLDERSGYPAGVLDPEWHFQVLKALQRKTPIEEIVEDFSVSLCRDLREEGQGGASVDAVELSRMTKDLATIRNIPTPGRLEFIEAAQTVLTQASEGRGRAVARSMEDVLIGDKRGRLPKEVPRCGLSKSMDTLFDALKLPTKGEKEYRLDPLRSLLDRRRHIAFRRMLLCDIRYANFVDSSFVAGLPSIQQKWDVKFSPSTEASIEIAGLFGVSLHQAAAGALRHRLNRIPEDELSHEQRFEYFVSACEAGLSELAQDWFQKWNSVWESEATLSLLVRVDRFLGQLAAGQVIGIPTEELASTIGPMDIDYEAAQDRILESVHRVLVGIVRSTEPSDAVALREIVYRDKGSMLLHEILRRMVEEGSELMQGAAVGLLVVADVSEFTTISVRLASWIDIATSSESRTALSFRLVGLLSSASLLFETHPELSEVLDERINALTDDDFMARLPAMRKGFDVLSEIDRNRLMNSLKERIDISDMNTMTISPELVAKFTSADLIASEKMALLISGTDDDEDEPEDEVEARGKNSKTVNEIDPADRWRLILGQQQQSLKGRARRAGIALEQMYGTGGGVRAGFGGGPGGGAGGGQEDSFPSTREWAEELENLFGEKVREEVLADAAPFLPAAALEMDPEVARPSVDLLQTILPLAGSMSESQLEKLRPLIQRCVEEVTKMLANRMGPALFGSASAKPTRRPNNRLDIPRTIRKNIARVYVNEEGRTELYPDHLIFKAAQKKSMDWDLFFLVDVSGSMEPSVIYSAIISAILTGVPWVNLKFLAFNTEIVDLTEHTADPLALLLEVKIGGGTNIGKAMAYAENLIRVPRRSIVMVLSDFEEGFSRSRVINTARNLSNSGTKVIGLASLDDSGKGRYDATLAKALVRVGMPVAALSPTELAQWIKEQVA